MEKLSSSQFAPGELASIYYWMGIVRLIGAPLIGGAIFALWRLKIFSFDPRIILYVVLPIYFVLTLAIWLAVSAYRINSPFLLYFEFFVNFTAITMSLYSSSAPIEFIFLYLLAIVPVILVSFRAALVVTLCSVLVSIALVISPHFDLASAFHKTRFGIDNAGIIHLVIFSFTVVMAAFQGYMFTSRIRKINRELMLMKDEFLFRTVHDLRSPFTTIRWIADKYSLPSYRTKYPDIAGDIAVVETINARILRLLQDLSAVVKGERMELVLKKEKINLSILVQNVLREKINAISARRIVVTNAPSEHPFYILADEQVTKEVLSNIIDNAIAYNKDGGEIFISHVEEGGMLLTKIKDTGRGIPQTDFGKLFQPYFRGVSVADTPGTGLGLYLVKKLVEKMNGTVSIASQEGKGTTVIISLPVS